MISVHWEGIAVVLKRWSDRVWRRPGIWILYAIPVVLMVGIRVYLLTRSADELLPYLIDDGFFHLQVAKHIAEGHGPTFDGVHLTNGFHPLWVWMLSILYWLFPNFYGSFFTASTTVQVALNLGSIYLVWRIARLLSSRPSIPWMAIVLYGLNPFVIFYTITGMETSLYLFLLTLIFWRFVKMVQSSSSSYLGIGILSGLLLLTRTESIILLGCLFVALLVPSRTRLRHALELGVPTLVAALVWMGWSWSTVHSLTQINAYAPALGRRLLYGLPVTPHSLYEGLFMIKFGAWTFTNAVKEYSAMLGLQVPVLMTTGLVLVMIAQSGRERVDRGWLRKTLGVYAIPFVGFLLIFLANTVVRWYSREYYILPWTLLATFFLLIVCEGVDRLRLPAKGAVQAMVVISALISFVGLYQDTYRESVALGNGGAGNTAVRAAAQWINDHAEPGAIVGSFKVSGVLSYWSRYQVQNLDGKINNAVFPYLMAGEAWNYLREQQIRYLVEPEGKLESRRGFFAKESFDGKLERVHQINQATLGYTPAMNMDIYRVIRY